MRAKNILLFYLALIASAVMLTVIQPPISWAPLAWVSLVPFVLACSPAAKPKHLALAAYLVSLCYWLGNLYWIAPITVVGWIAFCLYMALFWPILAICIRFCRTKKIPLFLAVPVLVVGAERLQGLFLGGFFWRFLAHSQYANITIIQIADIFGAAGLSFLIAMVNGLAAELILDARPAPIVRQQRTQPGGRFPAGRLGFNWCGVKTSNFLKTALVCTALVAAVAYGRWRINESDKFIEAGPLVASLQSNVPQSVKRSFQASEKIFNDLLIHSNESAETGAELIVWPETMVQARLDPRVLRLLSTSETGKIFDNALSEHSKNTAYVLVGAYGGVPGIQEDLTIHLAQRYNSAFLYRPDGQQDQKRYDKIHLVLFGEVLPFRKSSPLLFKLLMKFNPYGYDHSLDAGSEYTVFEMTSPVRNSTPVKNMVKKGKISNGASGEGREAQVYKFSVMICYEATMPAIAQRFAIDQKGQKRIHWLINISNDGWFVRFNDGKISPSTELPQHAAICVFRAVENRLAVLRSVNTGVSCLIDTLGRIRDGYIAASGDFPVTAMERKGLAGWFADKMPIDRRVTFFSKYGQWLDSCCAVGLVSLIIVIVVAGLKQKVKKL